VYCSIAESYSLDDIKELPLVLAASAFVLSTPFELAAALGAGVDVGAEVEADEDAAGADLDLVLASTSSSESRDAGAIE
jgi:hypothetical protein